MASGVRFRVWGDYACFTRPEMKVERVSYDVITPSSARGILEAIYWKPTIQWKIDRILVMKPIHFDNIRRNEITRKIPIMGKTGINATMRGENDLLRVSIESIRQQRAAMVLRDVEYIIEARFVYTSNKDHNDGKHLDIFNRRVSKGQCFHRPYLGCREFAAFFGPVEDENCTSPLTGERDLGWMLYDIDYLSNMTPIFYRPIMKEGVIDCRKEKVVKM